MKKVLTYILLALLSVGYNYSQVIEQKERDLFKKYKVQERVKYSHKYSNDIPSKEGVMTSKSVYNGDGLVLEISSYNAKGEPITTETYGYDNRGNRTSYERESLSGAYKKKSEYDEEDRIIVESGYDGTAAFKTMYKYNSNNKVVDIAYYVDNMIDEKRVYKYDGNKATVEVLHKGKTLKSTIYLVFNDNDQIIKESTVSIEGVETESKIVEYNSKGLIAKEEKYRAGNLYYRYSYQYDEQGEVVLVSEESSKGNFEKKKYVYDAEGRVIEYQWRRKPSQEFNIKSYKYGSVGVCIEEFTHYPKTNFKLLTKYRYRFY